MCKTGSQTVSVFLLCVCSGGRQEEDLCSSGVTILNQDFSSALETLQDAQSTAIGAPKVRTQQASKTVNSSCD